MRICLKCKVGTEFYATNGKYCKECVKEWGRKSRARKSAIWRVPVKCKYCPIIFTPRMRQQVICNEDTCEGYKPIIMERRRINHRKYTSSELGKKTKREGYQRRNKENPIRSKAYRFIGKLHWGVGGSDIMEAMMREVLGKPCYWCKTILTVENISMDHKKPIHHSKIKDYYPQELKELNAPENLRMICKPCNQMKSSIPEDKYAKLIEWLKGDPELERHVLNKLRTSNLMWMRNKR